MCGRRARPPWFHFGTPLSMVYAHGPQTAIGSIEHPAAVGNVVGADSRVEGRMAAAGFFNRTMLAQIFGCEFAVPVFADRARI